MREKNFYVHRGALPPNDGAFIKSRRVNMNIWWAPRRWYWFAHILAFLLNATHQNFDMNK